MPYRDSIDDASTTLVVCSCGGEGLVVTEWRPTDYDHGDIILSTWAEWEPQSLRWRIRMAWEALFGMPSDLGGYGIMLDCERARRVAAILTRAADELEQAESAAAAEAKA